LNADTFIKGKLADFCLREGIVSGGSDKMLAVAHVLRNRVDAGWYGGDWLLVLQAAELSRYTPFPETCRVMTLREAHAKVFLPQVDDVYHGSAEDETNGALYYADLHDVTSEYFKETIAQDRKNHPLVATIGLTSFFR
jgi:hypothetical protein